MRPEQRVVISTPLSELWNEAGTVAATRGSALGAADITDLLRRGPVQFVVADAGPLRWIPLTECYTLWKAEAKLRVVPAEAEQFQAEDYPGAYCYVASRWLWAETEHPLVLLERHH